MASSGKKGKKKWKPVALEEILPNTIVRSTTSWADEVECELNEDALKRINNINLPTAPRAACDLIIDESKIPQNGPFLAYLTNLPYEITEEDITAQFKELKVSNVQLPKDNRHDRMKGFGYVEFHDRSSLIQVLNEGEVNIKGRTVRISLPESENDKGQGRSFGGNMSFTRNRDSDRVDGPDKTAGDWRAAMHAPSTDGERSGFTRNRREYGQGSSFRDGESRFERNSDRQGSTFSRAFNRDGDRGNFSRDGGERSSAFGSRDGGERSSAFGSRDGGERSSAFGSRDRERSSAFSSRDGERNSTFGGRDGERNAFGGRDGDRRSFQRFDRDDRGGSNFESRRTGGAFTRRDDNFRKDKEEEEPEKSSEPRTRPKLQVLPRSIKVDANQAVEQVVSSAIFGGAKPVDTAAREREIEEKISKEKESAPPSVIKVTFGSQKLSTPTELSRASSMSSVHSFTSRRGDYSNREDAVPIHQSNEEIQGEIEYSEPSLKECTVGIQSLPPPEVEYSTSLEQEDTSSVHEYDIPFERELSPPLENYQVEKVAPKKDAVPSPDEPKVHPPIVYKPPQHRQDSNHSHPENTQSLEKASVPQPPFKPFIAQPLQESKEFTPSRSQDSKLLQPQQFKPPPSQTENILERARCQPSQESKDFRPIRQQEFKPTTSPFKEFRSSRQQELSPTSPPFKEFKPPEHQEFQPPPPPPPENVWEVRKRNTVTISNEEKPADTPVTTPSSLPPASSSDDISSELGSQSTQDIHSRFSSKEHIGHEEFIEVEEVDTLSDSKNKVENSDDDKPYYQEDSPAVKDKVVDDRPPPRNRNDNYQSYHNREPYDKNRSSNFRNENRSDRSRNDYRQNKSYRGGYNRNENNYNKNDSHNRNNENYNRDENRDRNANYDNKNETQNEGSNRIETFTRTNSYSNRNNDNYHQNRSRFGNRGGSSYRGRNSQDSRPPFQKYDKERSDYNRDKNDYKNNRFNNQSSSATYRSREKLNTRPFSNDQIKDQDNTIASVQENTTDNSNVDVQQNHIDSELKSAAIKPIAVIKPITNGEKEVKIEDNKNELESKQIDSQNTDTNQAQTTKQRKKKKKAQEDKDMVIPDQIPDENFEINNQKIKSEGGKKAKDQQNEKEKANGKNKATSDQDKQKITRERRNSEVSKAQKAKEEKQKKLQNRAASNRYTLLSNFEQI